VLADEADKVPRPSLAEKVRVSPESGFPFNVIVAVMVEVVEPAATVAGFAVRLSVPRAIVTVVDLDTPPQVAVTVAVPRAVPGESVTVATPLGFVIAVWELSVPSVVWNSTVTLLAMSPITSRIPVTVMVEIVAEPAAMELGDAEIPPISGSLMRTASNGIVCP